jgi:hypothetical protein
MSGILVDGAARDKQLAALASVADRMKVPHGNPSDLAAQVVLSMLENQSEA